MTFKVDDRTLETTVTTGTGAVNLAGAKTGRQSFVDGIGDGNTTSYLITDGTDWEVGIGTVSSGTPDQLSRDQVLASSNGDAAVNWGTGSKDVGCVAPASMFNGPAASARSISSAATLSIKDNGHVLRCSSSFTQALPALSAVFEGWGIWVKPEAGVTITIDPNGAETIEGASTFAATRPTLVIAGASEWEVMAGKSAMIATGTYTGDGTTSQAITGLGFPPKFVQIVHRETVDQTDVLVVTSSDVIVDDNASGGAIIDNAANTDFRTNLIIALGADGFTVDDNGVDSHPNKNGTTYNYVALG